MENNDIKIYTLSEIADDFKISRRTLYNWLSPIKQELLEMYPIQKKRLGLLLPKQVKRIYEFLC